MLTLPEERFARSVKKHNVDLVALADWIEASAVFLQEPVSMSDVIDLLCEEGVYDDQDFASERVDEAWDLLRENAEALGPNALVTVTDRTVEPVGAWSERPATALVLALSIAPMYAGLRAHLKDKYAEQGALFERVAQAALVARGWSVHLTGWQAGMEAQKFGDLIDGVQHFLFEPLRVPAAEELLSSANDAGLDLVCVWPFQDARPAAPALFVQCASGANWKTKLKTPDPEVWQKLIAFIVTPTRAIAIPFLLDGEVFKKSAMLQSGVLIDRLRLLRDLGAPDAWLDADTRTGLVTWLEPKLAGLAAAA